MLTIAERCFPRKSSQPGICRIRVEEFYRSYSQIPSCDRIFAEIVVKCEVKPGEDICKGIHIKSNCQDVYSSMLIFQSQGYCSEVLNV